MLKSIFTLLAVVIFTQIQGQNWLNFSVPKFSSDKIKASQVEVVNMYEIPANRNQNDPEAGHVVRVVKYPTMSFSFDRDGRMEDEIVYKDNSEAISTRTDYQHGAEGVTRKDVYTYTYNNDLSDTILAQHRIHRYLYDATGSLEFYLISESDGEQELKTDSVSLKYDSNGEIQTVDFQHLQRRIAAVTDYTHHDEHHSTGIKKGGGKSAIERDEKGRFVHVVDYLLDSDEPNMDIQFIYKKDQLDSTYAAYKPASTDDVEMNVITSGYYYDRGGKLVMVRTYNKEEMLREQLFEYFPYQTKE